MINNYHGIKPVTDSDKVLAGKHLNMTKKVVNKKIQDHRVAMNNATVPASKAYNRSHLLKHAAEVKSINNSLKTLSKIKGVK
jgi:hypothetical protein